MSESIKINDHEIFFQENFFNLTNPASPTIKVQFRTYPNSKVPEKLKLDDDESWEEIVDTSEVSGQKFQNYLFKSAKIEDNGGIHSLNLTMSDINVSELERIMMRTVVCDNYNMSSASVSTEDTVNSSGPYIDFISSEYVSAHIRVRFGYNSSSWYENVINDPRWEIGGKYDKRMYNPENMVIMSPWLYFMIQDIKTSYNYSSGLTAEFVGFSIGKSVTSFKIMKKYAVIRGTPKSVMKDLFAYDSEDSISKGFNNKVRFRFVTERDGKETAVVIDKKYVDKIPEFGDMFVYRNGDKVPEDKTTIDISLGRMTEQKAFGTSAPEFKNIEEILTEFCNKAPKRNLLDYGSKELLPAIIDGDGSDTGTSKKKDDTKKEVVIPGISIPLTYRISDKKDGFFYFDFYYPDPSNEVKKIRGYSFFGNQYNVIKNIDINGQASMWALLNMPIVSKDKNGNVSLDLYKGVMEDEQRNKDQNNKKIMEYEDGKKVIIPKVEHDKFKKITADVLSSNIFVVRDIKSNVTNSNEATTALINTINSNIYSGTIDLFGDPFFLFGDNMNPFFYKIYIDINKPKYFKLDGSISTDSKSPATGFYTVNKITHTIDNNGFSTTLDVMKTI